MKAEKQTVKLTLVSVDGGVHLEAKKIALDRGETLATLATRALQKEIARLRKAS